MTPAADRPAPDRTPFILGLGSNVGDRRANLALGLEYLSRRVSLESVSRLVESVPWGPAPPQGDFLNLLARGRTSMTPVDLLGLALRAEVEAGRTREVKYGPRTLDVDLIVFGDVRLDTPRLTLPHPHWRERPFVAFLVPDVAEGMTDPVTGRPLSLVAPRGPLPRGVREVEPLPLPALSP